VSENLVSTRFKEYFTAVVRLPIDRYFRWIRDIQGTSKGHSRDIQGTSKGHPRDLQEVLRDIKGCQGGYLGN